eukprot:COSAG06_NODE_1472_length_9346_cov_5.895750_5_plen_96_part_00
MFSGLLVFEQFGLLPIVIGNTLYASASFTLPDARHALPRCTPALHSRAVALPPLTVCRRVLSAVIKGAALFWMWEMEGSKTVFNLLKPLVDTKTA